MLNSRIAWCKEGPDFPFSSVISFSDVCSHVIHKVPTCNFSLVYITHLVALFWPFWSPDACLPRNTTTNSVNSCKTKNTDKLACFYTPEALVETVGGTDTPINQLKCFSGFLSVFNGVNLQVWGHSARSDPLLVLQTASSNTTTSLCGSCSGCVGWKRAKTPLKNDSQSLRTVITSRAKRGAAAGSGIEAQIGFIVISAHYHDQCAGF